MIVLLNDHINENYVFVDYCKAVSHYEQVAERIANNRFSVSAPVPDHVSNMAHIGNFGGTVDIEPFVQLGTLEYRCGHIIYGVEALESLIGFIQIRIGMRELFNPFFNNRSFQIIFGVDSGLLGNKHADGTLQQPVVRIRWFQIMLDLPADFADTVVQMFDDMEHIDADDSLGKDLPCNRDEAVVPVTVPDIAVAFEFINEDGFRKLADSIKADQVEDGVDDGFRYAVFFCHSSERLHFRQRETDVDVERLKERSDGATRKLRMQFLVCHL